MLGQTLELAPDLLLLQETETPAEAETTAEKLLRLKEDRDALKDEAESLSDEVKIRRAVLNDMLKVVEQGWEAENAELLQNEKDAKAEYERKDAELRAAVVAAWPGGNAPKTVAEGLSVKVMSKPVYDDSAAIQWAIEKNLPDLLKLDATKFKKAADALKPEFVRVESTIVAVIKD